MQKGPPELVDFSNTNFNNEVIEGDIEEESNKNE